MEKKEFLKGGDNLFQHEAVNSFYNEVFERWDFGQKEISLLLSCTPHKPYSESFMHKKIKGLLEKNNFDSKIQEYIIGEPLTVCPREWENKYPADSYEFPPDELGEDGKKIFIKRLKPFLKKLKSNYDETVVFVSNHYRDIINEANENFIDPIVVPYNIYNLPKLQETLNGIVEK